MSLIDPYKGKGNHAERMNKLELEVTRLIAAMNVYTTWFELNRRFFAEITAGMNLSSAPDDLDKTDNCKSQECQNQAEKQA